MPDPIRILEAMTAAAVAAVAVLLICGWPWRSAHPRRAAVGGALGVALGFLLGCWLLGLRPHWPPADDMDRLLLVLLPAVVAAEIAAAVVGQRRWLAWLLRLLVAACAARVLLHDTSYLAELAGPGSREWTPWQAWWILAGLAVALAGVWAAMACLTKRTQGRSVPLVVAAASCFAAVAVMLSGYATGGQMGFPLAAALAGATAASLVLSGTPESEAVLGPGVVGLFALLVAGRFFGSLTTAGAALLFFGPLLCWVLEFPPRLRGLARIVLVALPLAAAMALAQQKFVENSAGSSSGAQEPSDQNSAGPQPSSNQDYTNFGK